IEPLRARRRSGDITDQDYQHELSVFMSAHGPLKKAWASLAGRHAQAGALVHEIASSDTETIEIDGRRYLEIKTGHKRLRNRRFGPTNLWASEFPAKADRMQVLDLRKTTHRVDDADDEELDSINVLTSPRGRIFKVRAQDPADRPIHRPVTGTNWVERWRDDFTGPVRPLYGRDASGSM